MESGSPPDPPSPASSTFNCREAPPPSPSKCWFRLQPKKVMSFPSTGGGEAKPRDCLLRRHNVSLLPHGLPPEHPPLGRVCHPGWGRGCDGCSVVEQPVLSGVEEAHGHAERAVETLTCCCYHSPCEQLRNSKYFLSDKGDWGRPEISGRVWASLRSQTPGRRGQNWYWECWASGAERPRPRAVWELSKLPFPNLHPTPKMGREDAPACFPTPPHLGLLFPGDTSGIAVVQGLSYRSFWRWFPQGSAKRFPPESPAAPSCVSSSCCSVPGGRTGEQRGSCPLPVRTGLLSCSSPSVAPDSSSFTECYLSLVQQTLPFLRSKGFKTCFLELPFPKLEKAAGRLSCQPSPAPALDVGALSWSAPLLALWRG